MGFATSAAVTAAVHNSPWISTEQRPSMPAIRRPMQRTTAFTTALTLVFFITATMSPPIEAATPLAPAERSFVGEYVQSGRETIAQMAVLDDRTFCFAFIGGSVDLLLAGYWKLAPDGKGIQLNEVKVPKQQFPAFATPSPGGGNNTFEIDGYSMSSAVNPVFAYSATNAEPTEFRPLFAPTHNSWAERYTLPSVPAAQARYFYIGSSENDPDAPYGSAARNGPKRHKVVQYELRGAAKVLVGFNAEQNLIDLSQQPARLLGDTLHLGSQPFAKRRPISSERAEEAREGCIRPMFALAAGKTATGGQEGEKTNPDLKGHAELVPIKTFYVDPARIKGAPWFAAKEF